MQKLKILTIILVTFICASGFSIPSADSWKEFYDKNKDEIGDSLYCQYKPSTNKAGTINWISLDATDHSLMLTFNEGQNLNVSAQIFSNEDTSPNAANNQIAGTSNIIFLYNYVLKEVCPSNIYLYYYDAYGDGSYYTINMVSSLADLPNASDYNGSVTYTRGNPVKDTYERENDNITTDGDIDHYDGSITKGDGIKYTSNEEMGDASSVTYGNVEGLNFCDENGVKMTLNIIGYVVFAAKIIVPLLLIIMGTIDFTKALTSSDDKAVKDAFGKLVRRIIAGVIVFFIPTIFNFAFSLIDEMNEQSEFSQCSSCLFTPFNGGCSYTKLGR